MYKTGSNTVTAGTAITGYAALPADGEITAANGTNVTIVLAGKDSLLPIAYGNVTSVAS